MLDKLKKPSVPRPDLDEVRKRFKDRAKEMTPQLRKAAMALLTRPDDVALLSMREIATRSKVSPSTFVRLARVLDFPGYLELREAFVDNLRRTSGEYSPRAAQLQQGDDEHGDIGLIKKIFANKIRNIESTFDRNDTASLIKIAELLHKAERIFLVGQRSSYPIVYFFQYVLQLFSSKTVLLHGIGGTFGDDLRNINARDVLFVFSTRPYARKSILAAEYAVEHRCPVVAVTDNELSPLCHWAKYSYLADPSAPSFFDSIVAPLTIVEAVLGLMMIHGGKSALAKLKASEDQLKRFDAYWP